MAAPTLTYTLSNGSTADASQVMQNFNDLLNGVTDGTKDLSISALTCAGTATLNGHVNIGNASTDDLTITASLASTIPIKTTNTYNIGDATHGLAGVYFGTSDTDTARIVSASLAASRAYTMPDAGADASFVMTEGTQTINGTKTFAGQLIGKGTTAADDASTGYIGEHQRATASGTPANSTYFDAATITSLPAGDWDVSAWLVFNKNSATFSSTPMDFELGISNVSGNSATRLALGDTIVESIGVAPIGFSNHTLNIGPIRVKSDGTSMTVGNQSNATGANLYLKGYVGSFSTGAGGVTVNGTLRARRVR